LQETFSMKKALALLAVVLALGSTVASFDAEAARRLGGGKSSGMQRQNTTAPANQPPAGNNATPASPSQAAPANGAAAAGAAAAAPRRSWMGPLAGLAAGLGLAALASHFGFGEALANMMMIGLLVMAALLAFGWFMRKRAAGQGPAMATGGAGNPFQRQSPQEPMFRNGPASAPASGSIIGSRIGAGVGGVGEAPPVAGIPAGFDTAGFAANAKSQFLALQAANDARDLTRLRDFLTPEMFDFVRADIAERGDAPQQTEVFGLQAQVLSVVEEETRYVASVAFSGSVRDQQGAVPEDLDEVWHLTKPRNGSGGWMIAGIQQRAESPAA
jgi:predicted lipid-binding transport protein (Tim44 family)